MDLCLQTDLDNLIAAEQKTTTCIKKDCTKKREDKPVAAKPTTSIDDSKIKETTEEASASSIDENKKSETTEEASASSIVTLKNESDNKQPDDKHVSQDASNK